VVARWVVNMKEIAFPAAEQLIIDLTRMVGGGCGGKCLH